MIQSFLLIAWLMSWALKTTFAQTFPGFEPAAAEPLVVSWNSTTLNYSQQTVPISMVNTKALPVIGLPSLSKCNGTYLIVMVDPDALSGNIETQDGLHTIQGNFTCSASSKTSVGNTTFFQLRSPSPPLAPFVPPIPQPHSPPIAHRYSLILFSQPAQFTVAPSFLEALPLDLANVSNRLDFNIQAFAQSIGQPAVAGNVFKVVSPSASSTSGSATKPTDGIGASSTGVPIASKTSSAAAAKLIGVNSRALTHFGIEGMLTALAFWL